MYIKLKVKIGLVITMCACQMLNAQTYKSIVCDSLTRKPLQGAVVSLCSPKGEVLHSCMTNSDGSFQLQHFKGSTILQISILGYKSKKEILSLSLPDKFYLSPLILKEISITANQEIHDIDKDTYLVTDSLRKGTTFAADMLGQIKGINYNWFDNSLSVYGQKNILLLVNGVEKDQSYIKNINPKRITKIEVVHNPGGRYISDNYAAIINLILYDDYVGWDLYLAEDTKINPNKLDKAEGLFNEGVYPNFTYTSNKITVNASYNYSRKRMSFSDSYWQSYPGIIENTTTAIDENSPNIRKGDNNHSLSAGLDYQISKKHSISFQGKYDRQNGNASFDYSIWSNKTGSEAEKTYRIGQTNSVSNEWVGTLFYRGKIGERWDLYSDFNYDYYVNNSNANMDQENWFSSEYKYRNRKNYTRFNTEVTYSFNANATLKFGYSTTWKEYTSQNRLADVQESLLDNYRDRFFSYFSYKFNKAWSTSIGGAMEWIRDRSEDASANHFALMPDFKLMYKPNKSVDAVLQYYTTIDYPTLSQSSLYSYKADSLMSSSGNPNLTQALYNNASLRIRLWNCLTVSPSVCYSKNNIASFYKLLDDGHIMNTYVNSSLRKYALNLTFETSLWTYFAFSTNNSIGHDEIVYGENKNSDNVWINESSFIYMNRKTGWRTMLDFNRNSGRNMQIQGYSIGGDNYWMMALMKSCLNDRLSFMAAYFLPFKWLLNTTDKRIVNTAFYQYSSRTNTFDDVLKNMIMIKINYRLDHGKRVIKKEHNATVDHE